MGYTGRDVYPYLEHHNPLSYFPDVRNSSTQVLNLVPFTQFATDLANDHLPNFGFIVPNEEDDAHDCPDGTQNCNDSVKAFSRRLLAESQYQASPCQCDFSAGWFAHHCV